ncbi:protein of unknown function [Zobellia uliginosa]|uniref:Bacteroides conjugative transposon TraN protein n=1 Tax=Zobellia uliginosa TaxID=143224 RepID=A0ABY1L135_9FLAO|nr:DUF4138 domain-containing protein [Zobellia uliginosa]SIT01971.1 protein of unknown function [Zobellia uliginosa]
MKVSPIPFNLLIGFFFLFVSNTIVAQSPLAVACNENSTVSLFFPSKLVKIVEPGVNFRFTYDESSNIGALQGRKGKNSNLTVITENGFIFSFNLSYSENVGKFNYIISPEQAVGKLNQGPTVQSETNREPREDIQEAKESPLSKPSINEGGEMLKEAIVEKEIPSNPIENQIIPENSPKLESEGTVYNDAFGVEQDLYDVDREEYYRIFCENNYLQKTVFKRSFRQNKRIVLKLNNILVDREEIYFILQIENNSKREYHIDGVSFFKKAAVGQLQKIMKPRYTFNLQESLDPASVNEIVYVFKNFKLSSKELIYVALAEKDSDNMVILPLDNKQVNSPSN